MADVETGEVGCIHFPDDPNAVCTICKPKPKFDPWDVEANREAMMNDLNREIWGSDDGRVRIIEAMFQGTCKCGATIYVGDLIRRVDDKWQHIDCSSNG